MAASRPAVLVVPNKIEATPALVEAVRERAAAAPRSFFVLVPNPDHLAFDRNGTDTADGEQVLERALPAARGAGRAPRSRAASPTAPTPTTTSSRSWSRGSYSEIILETPPSHVSHWLHVDLPAADRRTSATR